MTLCACFLIGANLRFLWVQNGVQMTETGFSTLFCRLMRQFCGTGLSPRSWRQVAIGWAREYISPRTQMGTNRPMDAALTHTTGQARRGYGVNAADLPMLTPDAIWEQREACSDWWDNIGVGSATQPPQPLWFIRLGVPSAPSPTAVTQEDLATLLKDALGQFQASFARELPGLIKVASSQMPLPSSSPPRSSLASFNFPNQTSSRLFSRKASYSEVAYKNDASEPLLPPSFNSGRRDTEVDNEYKRDASEPLIPSSDGLYSMDLSEDTPEPTPSHVGAKILVPSTSEASSPFLYSEGPNLESFPDVGRDSEVSQLGAKSVWRYTKGGKVLVPSSSDTSGSRYDNINMSLLSDEEVRGLSDGDLTIMARQGIRLALDDAEAVESFPEQLLAIKLVIRGRLDFTLIIGTGGGKSLVWQALAKVRPKWGSIIVTPYVLVLAEQLKSSLAKGIVAAQYTANSTPPPDFQNLFIQPETGASKTFLR
jgi:hypothetical protein